MAKFKVSKEELMKKSIVTPPWYHVIPVFNELIFEGEEIIEEDFTTRDFTTIANKVINTKHNIPWEDTELSHCCGAIKDVVHGDESTNYYACSFCGKQFISKADYQKQEIKKIEKIKMNINDQYFRSNDELARKLNELVEVVNNLLEK